MLKGNGKFKKRIFFLCILVLIILGATVYFNSLRGEFVFDDDSLIKENLFIRSWKNVFRIFATDIGAGSGKHYFFYRPIQVLTYLIDYSFWKLNPLGYHLTNIFLHLFITILIFWLFNLLFSNISLSFFTSLLFTIHPVHTETVDYVSGRADLLVALFILTCFISYIKYFSSKSKWLYLAALFSYILAIFSKEYGLILPVLLLLYHFIFKVKIKFKLFSPFMLISFLYIVLRLTLLQHILPIKNEYAMPFLQRVCTSFAAIVDYLRLLILPFGLHMEYGFKQFPFRHPYVISGGVLSIILLCYAFRQRKRQVITSFAILWFFLLLLPQSNILQINAYMAEHWLYLPSIGFFLIISNGLNYLYKVKNLKSLVIIIVVPILFFYLFLTLRQNTFWQNPSVFYERTLRFVPDSARVINNLANIYQKDGKLEQAISMYKKSIEIKPDYVFAYNGLGTVYETTGEVEKAISAFKKAIESNPEYATAYNNLANIYKRIGKPNDAANFYKKAIEINPYYADSYYNLALLYQETDRIEEAAGVYRKVIEVNPAYARAYDNLGILMAYFGNQEEAFKLFTKAIKIAPDLASAHENLALIYYYRKQYDLAVKHCRAAIKLGYSVNPEFLKLLEPYQNSGVRE